jgi:hypothetical protein
MINRVNRRDRPLPIVGVRFLGRALCSVVACASTLTAQARPPQPDTATRPLLAPVSVTGPRMRAAPPPVATIAVDTTALVSIPADNAYDLLRRTAGLEVHEHGQGPGFTANAVVRGFNSDHSADVLLVVDGVPVNAAVHGHVEGFADWNLLMPAATQSLRIIHGSASPLYGDFALAGVVEVFTAADAERTSGSLTSSSFGDVGGWMRTGLRGARGGMLVAVDGRRGQGWQENSGSLLGNALLRGWRATGGGRLEGGLQFYRSTWDSPGFVSIARYNTRDLLRPVDSTDGGESQRLLAHARFARSIGRVAGRTVSAEATAWAQLASSDWYLTVPGEGFTTRQSRERDDRQAVGGQLQLLVPIRLGQVTAGTSVRADQADYLRDLTLARRTASTDHSYDATYGSASAFVRVQRIVGTRLALDAGARVDQLRYGVVDRLRSSTEQVRSRVVASPKLGVRYLTNWAPRAANVSLLGSLSRGFRGPVGVIADPSRAPYSAWSSEAGVAVEQANAGLHAALFNTTVTNERVFDAATLGVSSAGTSRRRGLDVRGHWRAMLGLPDAASIFGSMTLNDARFLRTSSNDTTTVNAVPQNTIHDHNIPIVPGDPVPGVARYHARIGATVPLWSVGSHTDHSVAQHAQLRVTYRVLGPFTPVGEPGVTTRAASVLDLGAAMPLPELQSRRTGQVRSLPDITLDVELQNVLNLRYVENRASGFITPGLPRLFRVGLRVGTPAAGTLDGTSH